MPLLIPVIAAKSLSLVLFYKFIIHCIAITPLVVTIICTKCAFLCSDTTSTFAQRWEAAVVRCPELGIFDVLINTLEALSWIESEHIPIFPLNRPTGSGKYMVDQLKNIIRDNNLRTLLPLLVMHTDRILESVDFQQQISEE